MTDNAAGIRGTIAKLSQLNDHGQVCGCPVNEAGGIRCHVCGEYVNVRCWNCKTPRGEGACPYSVGSADAWERADNEPFPQFDPPLAPPTQEDAHDSQAEPVSTPRGPDVPHLAFDTTGVRRIGYIGASPRSESTHCKCAERRAVRESAESNPDLIGPASYGGPGG